MSISKSLFGKTKDGNDIFLFTLKNQRNSEIGIINYGATVTFIKMPDKNGNFDNIVLGYDNIDSYYEQDKFFGATVGRHANRLKDSVLEIDGVIYKLNANEGNNQLHGGLSGFDKKLWSYDIRDDNLVLSYLSPDGEENYPGNFKVDVSFTLSNDNEFKIVYDGSSDKDTVVNLTNHSYFNLGGHMSGLILDNKLKIYADAFTVNDKSALPTGEIRSVEGTPFDFREFRRIGDGIESDYDQIVNAKGYDQNFVLNGSGYRLIAELIDEKSGRTMSTYTDMPGVQLYTANYVDGAPKGNNLKPYSDRSAVCLETQFFPNAIKNKNFPSPILRAGDRYHHITTYKFGII